MSGSGGSDILLGTAGPDHLVGGDGNDLIIGYDGPDQIEGSEGDDIIIGDDGALQLIANGIGTALLDGSSDTILKAASATLGGVKVGDYVWNLTANDFVRVVRVDDESEVETASLGSATWAEAEYLFFPARPVRWRISDAIHGGDGDDLIFGGGGGDFIQGGNHDDTIYGGSGPDKIFGDNRLVDENGDLRMDDFWRRRWPR